MSLPRPLWWIGWVAGRGWQGATIEKAFWFNHFNVFAPKAEVGAALPDYWHSVIVNKVGGKFDDLLLSAATHPAMRVYLDNAEWVARVQAARTATGWRRNTALLLG